MTQKEKTCFRSSAKWKKFRQYMKKLYEGKDALTLSPLRKGWNLHHLNEGDYKNLNPDWFIPCNLLTHRMWHALYIWWRKDHDILKRFEESFKKAEQLGENK